MVCPLIWLHFNKQSRYCRRVNKPDIPIFFLVKRGAQIQRRRHFMDHFILRVQNVYQKGWVFDNLCPHLLFLVTLGAKLVRRLGRRSASIVSFSRRFSLFCDCRSKIVIFSRCWVLFHFGWLIWIEDWNGQLVTFLVQWLDKIFAAVLSLIVSCSCWNSTSFALFWVIVDNISRLWVLLEISLFRLFDTILNSTFFRWIYS